MKKKYGAGEFNRRIFFQRAVTTDDGYGGKPMTWINCGEAWAKIEPLSGNEYFEAHNIQNVVSHRITIRYRTDIREDMRISAGGEAFEIESILDIEQGHQFMAIMCTEAR